MKFDNVSEFCILPFITLNTRPNGQVKVCSEVMNMPSIKENTDNNTLSESKNRYYNLSTDTINDIWNSEFMQDFRRKKLAGEPIKFCETCRLQEKIEGRSKRTSVNERFYNDNKELVEEAYNNNGEMKTLPVWWELRLSSICNQACRFCIPQTSSKMREEFLGFIEELPRSIAVNTYYADKNFKKFGYLGNNDLFMDQFWKNIENIKYIELHGGEPTADKHVIDLVTKLVERGYSKNIYLHVHTNAHILKQETIDLWNNFKSGWIGISIDAYKEENEYIRHGSNWPRIEENLKLLKTLGPHWSQWITSSITAYNCCTMHRLVEWFFNYVEENELYKLRLYAGHVTTPSLMNCEIVPLELRLESVEKLKKIKEKIRDDYEIKTIDDIIAIISSTHEPSRESICEFINYTKILDDKRKQNVLDIFPHLKVLFNE